MPATIKSIYNVLKNLWSSLWWVCAYPYNTIRSLLFPKIYLALDIYKSGSDAFRNVRAGFDLNRKEGKLSAYAHIVHFDLEGNIYSDLSDFTEEQRARAQYFEATIFSKDEDAQLYNKNKQFVILICGSNMCYEEIASYISDIADEQNNVIAFNPMGVGMSPGFTNGPEDYKVAINSIIKYLFCNKNVPQIVVQGYSLGAAIGLSAVVEFNKRHPKLRSRLKVIANRSFGRFDSTVASIAAKVYHWTLYYPVKILVNIFSFNIDATAAFEQINDQCHNIEDANAKGTHIEKDGFIEEIDSLYNCVNEKNKEFITIFKNSGYDLAHIQPDELLINIANDQQNCANFIKETRAKFKSVYIAKY